MRSTRLSPAGFLFAAACVTVLAGCGMTRDIAQDTLPSEISSQAEFRAWLAKWQEIDAEVDITEFTLREQAGIDATAPGRAVLPGELTGSGSQRFLEAPDHARSVDVRMRRGQPESAVLLYNRRGDELVETIASCEESCSYEAAFWLDNDRVVVLGQAQDMDADGKPMCADGANAWSCDRRLTADIYDLGTGTRRRYSSVMHRFPRAPYDELSPAPISSGSAVFAASAVSAASARSSVH